MVTFEITETFDGYQELFRKVIGVKISKELKRLFENVYKFVKKKILTSNTIWNKLTILKPKSGLRN